VGHRGNVHPRRLPASRSCACVAPRRSSASALQRGEAPPADGGLVRNRYNRLQAVLACAAVADPRPAAQRLAEEDAEQIESAYGTPGILIHLASYCGFFGTVLGLSFGLYATFMNGGQPSIRAFSAALATAFDTTLAGWQRPSCWSCCRA